MSIHGMMDVNEVGTGPRFKSHTFDWRMVISSPGLKVVDVRTFEHAPIKKWDALYSTGTKVEIQHDHQQGRNVFWVASVIESKGYYIRLRYVGFEGDPSQDFWEHIYSPNIHCIGWCISQENTPLIPPSVLFSSSHFYNVADWRTYLTEALTDSMTFPQMNEFLNEVRCSLKSKYKIGDQLEVVDKKRICQVRLATVRRIVGRRLLVKYFYSSEEDGFWCHEDSHLIHPKGWARTIGHEIVAPRYYAPDSLLLTPYDSEFEEMDLQVGMKLEAIDPLNLSAICAATIKKVLRRGYVMVRVDSYEQDSSCIGSDWFCYHISSPYVFPCGYCQENGITLTPPYECDKSTFRWDNYLSETDTRPAPVKQKRAINHEFQVGMKVEAVDLMNPGRICVATISHLVGRLLKIHFDGWSEVYDQWLDAHSPDIYPVGWCELVNYKLEHPPGLTIPTPLVEVDGNTQYRRRPTPHAASSSSSEASPQQLANESDDEDIDVVAV